MEFKLISPLNDSGFTKIEFNFAELKTELTNSLEKYKNLVYTDEQIKEAKTDRANLNKFRTALDEKKKEIKKMCMAPYDEFESKVKELLELVDEPVNKIDEQVKKYEDKKAQAKREELESHFFKNCANDLLTFDKIFNPKWLNATYTIKKCKEDIDNAINKFENELLIIKNYNFSEKMELQMINKYLETLSLAEVLEQKLRLERLQSKLKAIETKTNETTKEDVKPALNDNADPYKVVFEVEATKEQLQAIKRFLIENNIKYGYPKEKE